MTDSYYNTTKVGGQQLAQYEAKAQSQEEEVLAFFEAHPYCLFTRAELHTKVLQKAPVSSITRTLSNLKDLGVIRKTGKKRAGECGRPMYCWALTRDTIQGELQL